MIQTTLGHLLDRLESLTLLLQQHVQNEQNEPEVWLEILNERQRVIEDIESEVITGEAITSDEYQQTIDKIVEIDRTLAPEMQRQMKIVGDDISRLERSRMVQRQYGGIGDYDDNAYGVFFDKKK